MTEGLLSKDRYSTEIRDTCLPFLLESEKSMTNFQHDQIQPVIGQQELEDFKEKRRRRKRRRRRHTVKSSYTKRHSCYDVSQCDVFDGFGNRITRTHEESADDKPPKNEDGDADETTTVSLPDFSWLYTDTNYDETPVSCASVGLSTTEQPTLSQRMHDERVIIEEEIKRKYAEMEEVLDRLGTKRHRRHHSHHRRRRNTRHSSHREEADSAQPSYISIEPIRRQRRLAQPLRNALLMRSSMKKAWKGVLGSCCGMGCWATWKWVNLRYVISDYE